MWRESQLTNEPSTGTGNGNRFHVLEEVLVARLLGISYLPLDTVSRYYLGMLSWDPNKLWRLWRMM